MQIGLNLPRGMNDMKVDVGGQEVRGKGDRRPILYLEACIKHHSRFFDIGMQWATEMLLLQCK